MKVFKAYDIRGIYGSQLPADLVEKAGFFLPGLLQADSVLVGRDARTSTEEVYEALCRGITRAGADVVSIGLSTTPTLYHATATNGFRAAVQITASHNPPEYNGLKICKTGAQPVDYADGLAELEALCETGAICPAAMSGRIRHLDARPDYLDFLRQYLPDLRNLRIGVDCSNGMASLLIRSLLGSRPLYLNEEIDGTFPGHPPNPLEERNCLALQRLVLDNHLDIGLIFDGDADRVLFVDELGRVVQPDRITAILAEHYLANEKGVILHDIRTSLAVTRFIREQGGTPVMWKVGHSFAKRKMRELNAMVGGELAGHYYFRDFFNCDSGMLTALIVLETAADLKRKGQKFSMWFDRLAPLAGSGELNFHIEDKERAIAEVVAAVAAEEPPAAIYDFDGVRMEFPGWWFNIRSSNTEPLLRLIVEAESKELLHEKRSAIESILRGAGAQDDGPASRK